MYHQGVILDFGQR